jgi:2',3'-cyclic-nucleotide 2'-phosphodiesterase (5'-nucleotidase family)
MFARRLGALALCTLLFACKPPDSAAPPSDEPSSACGEQADGSRRFRVLHINDVYRIEGIADGRGGLARLRTLRRELEADCDAVLLTHAGDTLSPSLLSREYAGAQMIEILNALDGDLEGFDERMLVTFGNHEFDRSKLADAALLDELVEASGFSWLGTTITWARGEDGEPLVAADNLHQQRLLTLGAVRVGVFSLMTDAAVPAYVEAIDTDYVGVARAQTEALRGQGAEVVIALTHLAAADDLLVLDSLPGAEGPDLILGGHDHVLMTHERHGKPVLKGDADALRVRVVELAVDAHGALTWSADPQGTALGPELPRPDPEVWALVEARLAAFEQVFCGDEGPGCLARELTTTTTPLLAEELEIRRYESNYGNWIVDRMLDTFAADGVELAFLNSGSLRLNQDISAGTAITRQIVEETFAYPMPMRLIEIDGATLQLVLDRSVESWDGSGHWLQIAGWAYRHDVEAGSALGAVWLSPDGARPLDPNRRYRAVTLDFLLDPDKGQDGYAMLSPSMVVESPRDRTDLKQVVLEALAAAGEAGIGPQVEGRICSSDRADGPCLAP